MLNTHTYKDTQVHFCWPCSDLGCTTGGTRPVFLEPLLQIPFHPYLSVGRLIFCCWQRLSLETRRLSSLWGFYLCIFITVTKVGAPRSVALCSSLNSCGEVSCFSQTSPPTILAPTEGSRGQTATACSRCSLLVPPKGRALEQIWPLGRRLAGAREGRGGGQAKEEQEEDVESDLRRGTSAGGAGARMDGNVPLVSDHMTSAAVTRRLLRRRCHSHRLIPGAGRGLRWTLDTTQYVAKITNSNVPPGGALPCFPTSGLPG